VNAAPGATETGEPTRKHSPRFFFEPVKEAALNVQGLFEEGSGRLE
jgi:hypothetical protein